MTIPSGALDLTQLLRPWTLGKLVAGVSSIFGRSGAVVAATGDYSASQVTNDSTVTGAEVSNALDNLKAAISGLVTSVYGRTGAVVAAAGDYSASQVTNDSTVTGAEVSNALDNLKAAISGLVTSVYGRTGAVVAAAGDYTSTQVSNASAVAGTGVTGALNTLNSAIAALVTGVSSVYGRAGAVVAATGDYTSTQVTNSSTVTGTGVTGALNTLLGLINGILALSIGQYFATAETNTFTTTADDNFHAVTGSAFNTGSSDANWTFAASGCVATYIGSAARRVRVTIILTPDSSSGVNAFWVCAAVAKNSDLVGTSAPTVFSGRIGRAYVDFNTGSSQVIADAVIDVVTNDTIKPVCAAFNDPNGASGFNVIARRLVMTILDVN